MLGVRTSRSPIPIASGRAKKVCFPCKWRDDETDIGVGGPSEATIRLTLAQDEAQDAAMGGGKLHGSSVTSFLTAGLQLEDAQ
jgi:hypothetical protein